MYSPVVPFWAQLPLHITLYCRFTFRDTIYNALSLCSSIRCAWIPRMLLYKTVQQVNHDEEARCRLIDEKSSDGGHELWTGSFGTGLRMSGLDQSFRFYPILALF